MFRAVLFVSSSFFLHNINQFDIFITGTIFTTTTGALVAVEGAVSDVWIRDDINSSAASPPSFFYILYLLTKSIKSFIFMSLPLETTDLSIVRSP